MATNDKQRRGFPVTPEDMDRVMAAVEADDCVGFCLACGNEQGGVEPDAEGYRCEECGERSVWGADQILIRYGGV